MSRSIDSDTTDRCDQHPNSRMPLSQGRAGGATSAELKSASRDKESPRTTAKRNGSAHSELAAVIDSAAAGKPSLLQFIDRLDTRGVQVIPSIQSSGRLNGMSYRYQGVVVKGSDLGRAYTAQGLQERKGVDFDPNRDGPALLKAWDRAEIRNPDRLERVAGSSPGRQQRVRDRRSGLSADQKGTLADVGRFRTVAAKDLLKHRYDGNLGQFNRDIRVLTEAGLASRRSVEHLRSGAKVDVIVLTERGRNELRKAACESGEKQQYYSGFVKPAEVRHDVGIYRMYHAEAARIERNGGTVRRVILDFELKRKVFSDTNRGERSKAEYSQRKQKVADDYGLKIVDGKVVFPDLRIEYETRDQEMDKVDLELATADYRASQVRAKHAAGLKIYAPDSAAGCPAIQDPEIISELICL